MRAHERLLRGLVGRAVVAEQVAEEAADSRRHGGRRLRERLRVTRLGALQERDVVAPVCCFRLGLTPRLALM